MKKRYISSWVLRNAFDQIPRVFEALDSVGIRFSVPTILKEKLPKNVSSSLSSSLSPKSFSIKKKRIKGVVNFFVMIKHPGRDKKILVKLNPNVAEFILEFHQYLKDKELEQKINSKLFDLQFTRLIRKNKGKGVKEFSFDKKLEEHMKELKELRQKEFDALRKQRCKESSSLRDEKNKKADEVIWYLKNNYPKERLFRSPLLREVILS